jgi:hypothetical protein
MVAVVVIVAGIVSVAVFDDGTDAPRPAPSTSIDIQVERVGNGVAKDDAVVLRHEAGETLKRGNLIVTVGSDVVFNRNINPDEGGSGTVSTTLKGLNVQVDPGAFNDLNKPGPGPPGDGDGDSANVVNEWGDDLTAGDRLVIQERNNPQSYDVIQPGDRISVVWVDTEDRRHVIARKTVGEN